MSRTPTTAPKPGTVSRALARDRLGVPSVLFFVMAGVAPLTVAAGVIPSAYQTTGLTGIPAAFLVIAVILAIFSSGYVAMTRRITHSGAFYAFISRGLGRVTGVAAALVALLAYSFLQVGPVRRVRAERGQRGRRAPAHPCPLVGVGAGGVGRGRRPGPAAGGYHRPGSRCPAVRRAPGHRGGDRAGAGAPGGGAPQLRHAVPGRADLGRASAPSACWPWSRYSASSASVRHDVALCE